MNLIHHVAIAFDVIKSAYRTIHGLTSGFRDTQVFMGNIGLEEDRKRRE